MDIKRVALDAVNETIVITVVHGLQRSSTKKKNADRAKGLKGC
jgi:hypothetical protein